MLPEISDAAIINSDPVKTTSGSCSPDVMPTLELINKEMVNDSGHEPFSGVNQARVAVNSLTASWSYVR